MMGWGGGGWGMFGGIGMLVWWGLVIALIVFAVRYFAASGRGTSAGPDRALDILRERYARGEINKEEFEARKRELE